MGSEEMKRRGLANSAIRRRRKPRRRSRPPGGLSARDLHYLSQLHQAPGIRIRTRCDGFGAQYLAQMGALAWAVKHNRYYYFNGFSHLDHNENAEEMSTFTGLRRWGKRIRPSELAKVRYLPQVLGAKDPSFYFSQEAITIIRRMYNSSPKPGRCVHQIAIHIRRGDVSKKMRARWLSNKIYIELIQTLQAFFPKASIGIYSQGKPTDFEVFTKLGVTLELNRDLKQTFHELVTAPLLIPAPSCLSYAAAILAEGTVLHLANLQNRPLNHWLHSTALTWPRSTLLSKLLGTNNTSSTPESS